MKKHSWHWMVLWEKHLFFSYLGRGSCDSLFDVVWFMNNFPFCSYHLNMWSLWIIHYLVLFLLTYASMLEFLWDTTIMIMGYMKKNLGKNNWKTNLVIWILPKKIRVIWISISIKSFFIFLFINSLIWCYPKHHQTQYNLVRLFIRNSTKRLIILWINSQYSLEQINTIWHILISTIGRTKRAL